MSQTQILEISKCSGSRRNSGEFSGNALALGVVTYNNSSTQLDRLSCSIALAGRHLDRSHCRTVLYSTDCGAASEWPAIAIPHFTIESSGNLGFGRGMNRLLEVAFADSRVLWFLCVNPDGVLHRDLLVELISWSKKYPDSLVEARQFPEEHPKPYDPDTGQTVWASGACLLIPRKIYEVVGGFDENIFMYMEDVDLSWRAKEAGFTIRVAPRALFSHSVLDRKVSVEIERNCFFSARYLAYKWHKPAKQRFYEQVILERGYAATLPPLPRLDRDTFELLRAATSGDFDHDFAFAPLRWDPTQ